MKFKGTVIFVIITLLVVSAAIFISFNSNNAADIAQSSVAVSGGISSESIEKIRLEDLVSQSDNVLSGKVIKVDVDAFGALYTINLSFKNVLKGRNYTSLGYAYLKGEPSLEIGKTYLLFGDTGTEKYHYYEPFENAPWVFEIKEDKSLVHASNGNIMLIDGLDNFTYERVAEVCKAENKK